MFKHARGPSEISQCKCGTAKAAIAKVCRDCWKKDHVQRKKLISVPVSVPGTRMIPLSLGQFTVVDEAEYEPLIQHCWHAIWNKCTNSFYAARRVKNGTDAHISMQNQILGSKFVDHINHDTLDNRKINLRKSTRSENMRNRRLFSNSSSGITGVSYHSRDKKWQAFINADNKRTNLGYFGTKEEAAKARADAAVKIHGEFSCNPHLPATNI